MPDTTTNNEEASAPQPPDQLSRTEKYTAGLLLILFILAPALFIIAHWPDKIPGPKDGLKSLYINEAFHVRLAYVPDDCNCPDTFFVKGGRKDLQKLIATDTTKKTAPKKDTDSVRGSIMRANAAVGLGGSGTGKTPPNPKTEPEVSVTIAGGKPYYLINDLLSLDILLLMLVAAGDFWGI